MDQESPAECSIKATILWWEIVACILTGIGWVMFGPWIALFNFIGVTILAFFILIGVALCHYIKVAKHKVNLSPAQRHKVSKTTRFFNPTAVSKGNLIAYSAYITSRGRHGTIVTVATSKENAKLKIIEMFPDCTFNFFGEWMQEGNYIIKGNLDD